MTWSTFVRRFDQTFTASAFTPDLAVTVTRIEVQLQTAPAGCTVNARFRVTDGTTGRAVVINAAREDTGPIALTFAAGARISVEVNRTAQGCVTNPAIANIVVQYKN
jgi:hypothetical protein